MVIDMKRKRRDQKVRRLRARDGGEFHEIARRMARWADDNMAALGDADPAVPEELNDRAADAWVPPLAIADAIDGGWPRRAREAAIELSGEETDTQSHGEQLLADIRYPFAESNADRLSSDELVAYLVRLEGRPWAELGKTRKPLTKNGLAVLLRPFKIHSDSIRLDDGRTPKGYHRRAFEDAFARYLSVAPVRNATSPQASISAVSSDFQNATDGNGVAFQDRKSASVSAGCGGVAFPNPVLTLMTSSPSAPASSNSTAAIREPRPSSARGADRPARQELAPLTTATGPPCRWCAFSMLPPRERASNGS